jgi:hypothetical protein
MSVADRYLRLEGIYCFRVQKREINWYLCTLLHRTENLKCLTRLCKSKFPYTFPHVFCTVTLGVRTSPPLNFCNIPELTVSPESCNRRHLRTKLNNEVYSHCVNVRIGPRRRWLRRWNVESAEAAAALISSQPLSMSMSNPLLLLPTSQIIQLQK